MTIRLKSWTSLYFFYRYFLFFFSFLNLEIGSNSLVFALTLLLSSIDTLVKQDKLFLSSLCPRCEAPTMPIPYYQCDCC